MIDLLDPATWPDKIRDLPRTAQGLPIPWFVPSIEGVPNFRAASSVKIDEALKGKRCWICGQPNGVFLCFVVGVQSTFLRTVHEPPSHLGCAEFAMTACPFLSGAMAGPSDTPTPPGFGYPPGTALDDNAVVAIWSTRDSKLFRRDGRVVFELGEPTTITWWRQGRRATRDEILEANGRELAELVRQITERGTAADVKQLEAAILATHRFVPNG